MKHVTLAVGIALGMVGPVTSALAQHNHDHSMPMESAAAQQVYTEGVVNRIDKSAGKLTIKHGPIKNLGMPGMTMSFKVDDSGTLEKVKVGDKVRFVADEGKGGLVANSIESMK